MIPDPRLGLPSASGIGRIAPCPGSHKAEQEAKLRIPDDSNADTAAGNEVHSIRSGDLSEEEASSFGVTTAERCDEQIADIAAAWADSIGAELPEPTREVRLGLTVLATVIDVTPETAARASFVFTGQYDEAYHVGTNGLVIDTKGLFGDHDQAVDNAQLMTLAVLYAKRHKLTRVRVALVQPWKGRPTIADYFAEDLRRAEEWLKNVLLREAQATPADRKAGKHCTHCRARFACDAFKAGPLQEIERIQPMSIAGLPPKEQVSAMWARAMEFAPEQHIGAYRGLAMMKRYVHAIESTFAARVEAGEIPGFAIATRPGNREILDAQKAFDALAPLGLTAEDMLAASSVAIGPLEEALRKRSGVKSQTEKRTVYNLTGAEAKRKLTAALEAANALGRKADARSVVENNELEEQA